MKVPRIKALLGLENKLERGQIYLFSDPSSRWFKFPCFFYHFIQNFRKIELQKNFENIFQKNCRRWYSVYYQKMYSDRRRHGFDSKRWQNSVRRDTSWTLLARIRTGLFLTPSLSDSQIPSNSVEHNRKKFRTNKNKKKA